MTQIAIKQISGLVVALDGKASSAISILSGTGLTGGGTLQSSRTLALTGQVLALHQLSNNGLIARTASGTVAARSLTGTVNQIVVDNGDGVSANPTISLALSGVVASTYKSVTVDNTGRITAGTNPTTLSGFGITDALGLAGGILTGNVFFSNAMAVSAPTLTLRSAGTRLVFQDLVSVSSVDYAIGMESNKLWISMPSNSGSYALNFYAGNNLIANLNGLGDLTLTGELNATKKSFLIKHPSKKGYNLQYGSLEGPEYGVYCRGRSNTLTIQLPSYWKNLVREESLTVHITSRNNNQYVIESVTATRIKLRFTNNTKYADIDFDWLVFATRKDVDSLIVEPKITLHP